MRDVAFGQYYPAESVIHRLDSRLKIILTILFIVSIFLIRSYAGYLFAFLLFIIVVLLSRIPLRLVFKSIKPMIFLILFTLILNLFFAGGTAGEITIDLIFHSFIVENRIFEWGWLRMHWTSIDFAVRMALRLIMLVMCPSLLTLTTTPVDLTNGIESLLRPLRIIRFPVHELALIMSIALRLIPTIMEETDKIILAQKARCADFDSRNIFKKAKALLPVLIPLFVSSIKRADALADAMDSRCYNGSKGRTRLKKLKLRKRDFFAFAFAGVYFFAVLLLSYNYWDFAWINILV
jgi:energy-coupling factor transport system permease protein